MLCIAVLGRWGTGGFDRDTFHVQPQFRLLARGWGNSDTDETLVTRD